jgi:HSP20 family protein
MGALTKWNPFRTSSGIEDWGPLARWSPFREMERMQREMDQWAPCVDVTEDGKEFVVKAELPEVKKEDVKVTVENDVLTIRGERKAEKEEKGRKYHRIERSYGSFERSFTLPEATDASKISSEFKDGVLTVHLPKNPNARPKTTEIKVQ